MGSSLSVAKVRQIALADFYVEYRLIAHSLIDDPSERINMLRGLHANIQDVFNEHGVQIMSPHYMTDPAEMQVVTKERWYTPPAKPPAIQTVNAVAVSSALGDRRLSAGIV